MGNLSRKQLFKFDGSFLDTKNKVIAKQYTYMGSSAPVNAEVVQVYIPKVGEIVFLGDQPIFYANTFGIGSQQPITDTGNPRLHAKYMSALQESKFYRKAKRDHLGELTVERFFLKRNSK